ncbi:Hypothetical_protein [Hexamita inflata]|uniref:Hypothetical_protein n=1 Tax=Hexamita inflata TaxID=28002 RepID=A0AA86QVL6_9EUKA|nr:Hypothetical protein HINF_LOCUS47814 [Hexamita inflata]
MKIVRFLADSNFPYTASERRNTAKAAVQRQFQFFKSPNQWVLFGIAERRFIFCPQIYVLYCIRRRFLMPRCIPDIPGLKRQTNEIQPQTTIQATKMKQNIRSHLIFWASVSRRNRFAQAIEDTGPRTDPAQCCEYLVPYIYQNYKNGMLNLQYWRHQFRFKICDAS